MGKVQNFSARVFGNGDDTGTFSGRLKVLEGKVDCLMDLKKEIELLRKRHNSVFLRVKDMLIIVSLIVTTILSLKSLGVI